MYINIQGIGDRPERVESGSLVSTFYIGDRASRKTAILGKLSLRILSLSPLPFYFLTN